MPEPSLLPTSLVGSYAQPEWLLDRAKLAGRFPPRVRATELWRVEPRFLVQAQDDATELAIRAQERAGLDIVTDGRSSARATPTISPPRWTASTSTVPAPHWTAPGTPTRCPGSSDRSAARAPCRSVTWSSCAPTPTAR